MRNEQFPRIGLLTTFYPEIYGGAEASLGVLLEGFRYFGIASTLFTLSHTKNPDGAIPLTPLNYIPRRLKILGSPAFDSALARLVARLISRNHIDILHVQDTYSLPGAIRGAQTVNVPVILSYHNGIGIPHASFGAPYPFNVLLDIREKSIIRQLRNSAAIIANSDYTAVQLIASGISPSNIRRIYVGGAIWCVDHSLQPTNHDELRVLAVGRLIRHKGFHNLLVAVKRAASNDVNLRLIIVGDGPQRRQLSQLVIKLGISHCAKLVGRTSNRQLVSLYDWSDVVVVPSITPEAFGRVAVEAMSRGRAVIGSNTGGLSEVIIDGKTGFLVAPDSAAEIAQKLETLSRNRDLVHNMGSQGFEKCRSSFSCELITRQLLDIYASLGSNS